jgi:hypothetical protein
MAVIINGDTGIDKITDGSVVADDLASTLDLSGKTITLATDAAVVSKLSTASGSAPSYSARAWVNFNGTGTVAIRESGNVSSITDNGNGEYTVNFTTAMSDVNYAVSGCARGDTAITNGGGLALKIGLTQSTTAIRISTLGFGSSSIIADDSPEVSVAIFR